MKARNIILAAALALATSGAAIAQFTQTPPQQSSPMQNMPMQNMGNMPMQNMPMKGMMHSGDAEGVGVVQAVNPDQGTVTIKHQAIESIHWPAMTMTFKAAKPDVLQGVKPGEHVHFGLHTEGMKGTVTWIKPDTQ